MDSILATFFSEHRQRDACCYKIKIKPEALPDSTNEVSPIRRGTCATLLLKTSWDHFERALGNINFKQVGKASNTGSKQNSTEHFVEWT